MNRKEIYHSPAVEIIEIELDDTVMNASQESYTLGGEVNDVEFQSRKRGFWE